jgi:hypothetical protein
MLNLYTWFVKGAGQKIKEFLLNTQFLTTKLCRKTFKLQTSRQKCKNVKLGMTDENWLI